MENFNIRHAELLYLRFCAIYDHKFVKNYHDDDFKSLWAYEWSTGLVGVSALVIKGALEYCKKSLEWPPSIAEFRKICESGSGIPNSDEALNLAVQRNFNHPIVLIAYEKVGSWAMKNDSSTQLKIKFQSAYEYALNKFRLEEKNCWNQLECFNAKPKELASPEKIPSTQEIKSFSAMLEKYRKIAADEKAKHGEDCYRQFDEKKINTRLRTFDKDVYEEYREYLLSIPEEKALILPVKYLYDRNRFILAKEVELEHKNRGTHANPQGNKNNSTTGFNGGNGNSWGGY